MKIHQNLVLYLFPLIILAGLANDALASCPTTRQGPPCQEFWRTEAVFIGVASRIVQTPNTTGLMIGPYVRTTVYFSIEEAGVSDLGGATVIVVDKEHEPREYDFRLPIQQ